MSILIKACMINTMLNYAFTFMWTPYKWGGDNRWEGMDCSGFVIEVLRGVGVEIPDLSAIYIYSHLKTKLNWSSSTEIKPGHILFFGKSKTKITHIAIALNDKLMIESGGGDINYTSEQSKKIGAGVRQRAIREDLVDVLVPKLI